ncbi:MAG TPA: ABC transporter permease [Acidobacteriota bacterium]|nr:ABC transporter permease [Acidobacteriota bacterium]
MGALGRVAVIIGYEWRRAIAKKKILALIILAVTFQALVMIALSQVGTGVLSPYGFGMSSLIWIIGVLEGQGLFVQLIAIIAAGGSMSEEYEHGTADILLSKPITRLEYLFGKFLGGFFLLAMVEALTTVVGIILSLLLFGAQNGLEFAPLMFLAIVYSSLVFFSLSFMCSEVFRGSTLAMLIALGVFIASIVINGILIYLPSMSDLIKVIPTWAASSFPSLVMSKLVTGFGTADTNALVQASIIIVVYAIIFVLIAAYRLVNSDVSKKTG